MTPPPPPPPPATGAYIRIEYRAPGANHVEHIEIRPNPVAVAQIVRMVRSFVQVLLNPTAGGER